MLRYLAALIWPAGILVIFGMAYLMVRRSPATADGDRLAAADGARESRVSGSGHRRRAAKAGPSSRPDLAEFAKFIILAFAGAVVVFGGMALLGLLVVYHGLTIDKPIFTWIIHHQVHSVAAVLGRLTKIGNTWTAWGAAAAAAVCLSVTWRARRWLPPVALGTLVFADHYTTLALRHVFERVGPPTSPLGTYPSGGCERVIVFYGLIAYLLWREFSGRRATAIWAGAVVLALGFNEDYSRVYLGLHWFTDALSGLLYGGLMLAVFIFAVRAVADRVPVTQLAARKHASGVPAAASKPGRQRRRRLTTS